MTHHDRDGACRYMREPEKSDPLLEPEPLHPVDFAIREDGYETVESKLEQQMMMSQVTKAECGCAVGY